MVKSRGWVGMYFFYKHATMIEIECGKERMGSKIVITYHAGKNKMIGDDV